MSLATLFFGGGTHSTASNYTNLFMYNIETKRVIETITDMALTIWKITASIRISYTRYFMEGGGERE